jgi:hypothetical protein
MSKVDNECNNWLSCGLSIVAMVILYSFIIVFPTQTYAQIPSSQGTSQGSIESGDEQESFDNSTGSQNYANSSTNQPNSPLIMTTDKTVYTPGEIVNVTITNTGKEPLTFPNAALGLTIINVERNQTFPIFSAQMITTLDPNASKSVTWGPISQNGSEVPLGNYIASLGSGSSTEEVNFIISG